MKERPILFSAPMIRAILDGRKSMTRRVMKPIPAFPDSYFKKRVEIVGDEALFYRPGAELPAYRFRCPFGQPGSKLWVRETFYYEEHMHDLTDGESDLPGGKYSHRRIYRASQPDYPVNVGVGAHGWIPSIHCPRWASRITLLVKAVRVERLQDINGGDAVAEGMQFQGTCHGCGSCGGGLDCQDSPEEQFIDLWQSLNAKRPGCSWEDNPWCWVVEFEMRKGGAA